jgi:predicted transcriptional regulator
MSTKQNIRSYSLFVLDQIHRRYMIHVLINAQRLQSLDSYQLTRFRQLLQAAR